MGSTSQTVDFSSLYTSNYSWGSNGKATSESWFTVSVGPTVYTYNFPKGIVQSLYPDQISEKAAPNWSGSSVLNKAGQLWAYSGVSDRTYSFSFDLAADAFVNKGAVAFSTSYKNGKASSSAIYLKNSISSATPFDDFVDGLKRTVYADYNGDTMYPPLTTFCFGNFKIRGFVNNISFTWKKPIIDGKYSKLNVSVDMTQLLNAGGSTNKVITGSYIQGTTAYNIGGI